MKAVVLSDLHLDASGGTARDEAFVSFLEWLTARDRSDGDTPLRLVVLGDFLDLMHPPTAAAEPRAALEAVADSHRSALAALGTAAASGIQVDLVPGNHDSELLDGDLQEHLRVLVGDAAGISGDRLPTFHVRPWFLLVPGFLYAEHGSQYHPLNAVADPMAPFGRWSARRPPGAVLDLALHGMSSGAARARALPRLLPTVLRAEAARRRSDATAVASSQAYGRDAGLSSEAIDALRDLSEDSPVALARNLSAALVRRTDYVESRQQHAALAIHQILAQEGKTVPLYVFGHTHRVARRSLAAGNDSLLWLNAGAWADGNYCFAEVDDGSDEVVACLWEWDAASRSAHKLSDPLPSKSSVAQERELATRARKAGDRSEDPVATP
jgi:UDP-2,3-diacylglucosamine pyrophosphatase LpxH